MVPTSINFWVALASLVVGFYPVFEVGRKLFREAFPKFLIIKDADGHTLAALSAEDVVKEEPGRLRLVHEKVRQRVDGNKAPGNRVAA